MVRKGSRMRAAIGGFRNTNKGEIVRHALEGGIGGAAVKSVPETLEVGRAKRKAHEFLDNEKTSAFEQSLGKVAKKLQPVRLSRLPPIVENDLDYEI